MMEASGVDFVGRLLEVIEADIVPRIARGVGQGDKVFGAAVLRKSDWSLVTAGANHETGNPLWHGEIHTLQAFYELPGDDRPATKDCLFLSTHEPCSLCLSAITWAGFDNFYYYFSYAETADSFNIPHDLKILQEVFGVEKGAYRRDNHYWRSHDLQALARALPAPDRSRLAARQAKIENDFADLSDRYQATKGGTGIPLA